MTCAHSEICKTSLARQAVVTGNDGLSINIAPTIPHFIAWVCLKSHCPSALSLSSIHWNLGKLLFAKMSRSCSHDSSAVTEHVSSPLWGNRSGDWSSLKSRQRKGPPRGNMGKEFSDLLCPRCVSRGYGCPRCCPALLPAKTRHSPVQPTQRIAEASSPLASKLWNIQGPVVGPFAVKS